MSDYVVRIKLNISKETVEDIMESALRGITYWADAAEIKTHHPDDMLPSEAITHEYALWIHDAEENKWRILTMNKFLKGFAQMENLRYQDYDMFDADQLIQYALFGKQVYA